MKTQELVLLGLLMEGPKHGYQIKKSIVEMLGTFTNVDTKSVYYPLRKLASQGLIDQRKSRSGRRPEKYVYHLTSRGKKRFVQLLNRSFLFIERPHLNVDLSLYFLPYVQPEIAQRRLKVRLGGLKKIKKWLLNMKKTLNRKTPSYHLLAIIQHNLELVATEIKFTFQLIKIFKSHQRQL